MELHQLRCFIAVAEELHFGHAAQRMGMMPASFGRFIRLLEEDLGVRLLNRSTRNVSLTAEGTAFFGEAAQLVAQADALAARFRQAGKALRRPLRIGAIDSAACGLIPHLLMMCGQTRPELEIHITEDKTANLIPRLKSGWLDVAFIRPPEQLDPRLELAFIAREHCVLAVPLGHPLAARRSVTVLDFQAEPMIIPERRARPHSHDLTISIFKSAGFSPRIAQYAEEKQTILSFVAAGLGLAIVPASFSNMNSEGVAYIPLKLEKSLKGLPLSAAWLKGAADPATHSLLAIIAEHKQWLATHL
ncbi:LysR family transcriptional regulator [Nissabacter sp. SGAir0207]|uniref:LysR family transcriptional regulator n=1 Tax=Nissabacter sp. SGAir0207 TaxID=2126321 RepID=UPI0010CD3512|nr:LysR family transcriptional regulator [Nissabacter sp. SGAir0207]QCR38429.1 LysR family transcriptional regulator [Nissabacter sp. SGAir0207]